MALFGLDPESVAGRVESSTAKTSIPTLLQSLGAGAFGFCAVSLLVFGSWAYAGKWMFESLGELGAYLLWAAVFVVGAGGTLSPLVIGPARIARFYGVFTLGFFLYALVWTAAWMALRNQVGEWLGSLAGTMALGLVFAAAFSAWRACGKVITALFVAHSAGYFLGELLYATFGRPLGMLLWGVAYGLGFGSGLGYGLYASQENIRRRLAEHNK